MPKPRRRSGCPINLTLETFGDRWSLIILRDIMFGNRRTFRALLAGSLEGIASNILADRLERLTEHGLLSRCGDPGHKQRVIYSLTEQAIALVPIMAAMGSWGLRHTPASRNCRSARKSSKTAARRYGPSSWTSCGTSTSARRRPQPRSLPGCSRRMQRRSRRAGRRLS